VISGAVIVALLLGAGFLFWRHIWFFRDPPRTVPALPGLLSPADGTVVYVRRVAPGEPVVSIKRNLAATIEDLVRTDVEGTKLVIGIFMSPFNVHYNRAPLTATIDFIQHHPSWGKNRNMAPMHRRILMGRAPFYAGSVHIVQNERTVTRFLARYRDAELPYYVVQIGARTVNGIDSYFRPGEEVARGQTFGMIRVGSQVDLIVPWRAKFEILVQPGEKVRAGETVLVR
jgi:phosphatidylserine decarboxylase